MLREEQADPDFKVVNRRRHHFVYKDLPYSVDCYENILGQDYVYILRFANSENADPASLLPEFIKVEKDVRSDPQFRLKEIAKNK